MPLKLYTEEEFDALARERNGLQTRVAALEQLCPVWAQGHTSEQVAMQVQAGALAQLWTLLGANNQTEAVSRLKTLIKRY